MFEFDRYAYPVQRDTVLDAQEEIAWNLVQLADRNQGKVEYTRTLDRLLHEVVWFATLIEPTKSAKYWRQRYVSQGAYDFFKRYNEHHKKGLGKTKACAAAGAPRGSIGSYLQHEHVYPCAVLQGELLKTKQRSEVRTILEKAAACVVTRAEHKALAKNAQGWDRYSKADPPVAVWDRMNGTWI